MFDFRTRSLRIRTRRTAVVSLLFFLLLEAAEAQFYAGALGGVSTLSGDAQARIQPEVTNFSQYDPENGPLLSFVLGKHLSNYFSLQADYVWNRNALTLTSGVLHSGTFAGYQERRRSSEQSVFSELLVYFRGRQSRLRPYLSLGAGFVHLSSTQERLGQLVGSPGVPPGKFSSNMIALRVPVGMDMRLGKGWFLRYTFSETLSDNPISDHLSPPPAHSLKNFQNQFGIIKRF